MKSIILLISCLFLKLSFADTMLAQWSSPLQDQTSKRTLMIGTVVTGSLVLLKSSTIDRFQASAQRHGVMSKDMAHFGDIMGQVVPNVLYIGGSLIGANYTDNKNLYFRRINVMAQATFYSGVTTMILKRVVNQKRPNSENRHSFPSGHTTTAFAFASVVAMEHEWYWGAGAYSIATIVGLSRIHDNAHYLHDVVMGASIGAAYGIALSKLSLQKKDDFYALAPVPGGFMIRKEMTF